MEKALIVAGSEKSADALAEMLKTAGIKELKHVKGASEASAELEVEGSSYDICVINTPLADSRGDELALKIVDEGKIEVMFLAKSDVLEQESAMLESRGVLCLAKPINKTLFLTVFKLANAAHQRIKIFRSENQKLQQKIEDIKIIDRAKLLLISVLSMSEKEAHRQIEKQAMDMRTSRRKVAEQIIKTYEM